MRVRLSLTLEAQGDSERRTRGFGGEGFASVLNAPKDCARGILVEQFGRLRFRRLLPVDEQGRDMIVQQASCKGVRWPRCFTPISRTRQSVDAYGCFQFDVDISLPLLGRVVRDRRWPVPAATSD